MRQPVDHLFVARGSHPVVGTLVPVAALAAAAWALALPTAAAAALGLVGGLSLAGSV